MLVRALIWAALVGADAAIGLAIAPSATAAGWVAYAAGSLLWLMLVSSLLIHGDGDAW